jgi:hypothetical protein
MNSQLNQAIAQHLTIKGIATEAGEIVKVTELAHVFCVVVAGRAARFVSKKAVLILVQELATAIFQISAPTKASQKKAWMARITDTAHFSDRLLACDHLMPAPQSPSHALCYEIREVGVYLTARSYYRAAILDGKIELERISFSEARSLVEEQD